MNLYRVLDEKDCLINEFNQKGMAEGHLEVIEQLHPEHHYRIGKVLVGENYTSGKVNPNLIMNFG